MNVNAWKTARGKSARLASDQTKLLETLRRHVPSDNICANTAWQLLCAEAAESDEKLRRKWAALFAMLGIKK